jgi:hypothetical protein
VVARVAGIVLLQMPAISEREFARRLRLSRFRGHDFVKCPRGYEFMQNYTK